MNPEIVLGPPGTGKTTTLLGIVEEELARGVPPNRIGYVSFTKKAATEAAERACERFGFARSDFPYFRTLHSLCFRQLAINGSDVLEGRRIQEFGDYIGMRITGRWSDDGTFAGFEKGDRCLFMENLARVRMIPLRQQYDQDDDGLTWHDVLRVSEGLRLFKEARGLLDYTDMLHDFVRSGVQVSLDVLLVDEAQDLSALQWAVVRKLAANCQRVIVAGDDDQAIYRWAGADVDQFISMEGDVRVLGQSYRCPILVQELSNEVLRGIRNRRDKAWSPKAEQGTIRREADFVHADLSGEDILVLARNAYIIKEQVIPSLRSRGIMYELHGHSSMNEKMVNSILNWEHLRKGGTIPITDAREMYTYLKVDSGVKRGHMKLPKFDDEAIVSMEDLRERGGLLRNDVWYDALERIPPDDLSYVLAALRQGQKLRGKPRVRLSTIHGAKGGQGEHVILMTEMARRTFYEMEQNPEDEARVWYVGVTRAISELTIVNSATKQFFTL